MAEPQQPTTSYGVRLSKESFTFAAAHFITYDGDVCEPLHGHNYALRVELEGPLDENAYVYDFIATRDAIQRLVHQLDHCVLLPTEHPRILVQRVTEAGQDEVIARFEERRWVFPAADCRLLPLPNTTAEMLANWIGRQLIDVLPGLTALVVEVEECAGQAGLWRWRRS
ncbi:6-pyruvoyl trahydropterin synthase family protein [Botrimarina hoheduenensis]|uniref:6-carboxy-5,6,7,8-tetrahydropterin synthase n=1 Tax=Botrimarina hoheduenensis TaxID=2528000 RepID=A0A5C5WA91_9BACT|nr:6-pyruvoyl tetrahydropterin synthase family protein [Botrimarina hoheduenensis]TWT47417.1 6-carboxy-5,6,7,8-tetrahydropterin synthase [Botrimarina hoheduenensis]